MGVVWFRSLGCLFENVFAHLNLVLELLSLADRDLVQRGFYQVTRHQLDEKKACPAMPGTSCRTSLESSHDLVWNQVD